MMKLWCVVDDQRFVIVTAALQLAEHTGLRFAGTGRYVYSQGSRDNP